MCINVCILMYYYINDIMCINILMYVLIMCNDNILLIMILCNVIINM